MFIIPVLLHLDVKIKLASLKTDSTTIISSTLQSYFRRHCFVAPKTFSASTVLEKSYPLQNYFHKREHIYNSFHSPTPSLMLLTSTPSNSTLSKRLKFSAMPYSASLFG